MGKGEWDRQRVRETEERKRKRERERERVVFHWAGKQCHLLIPVRDDVMQQRHRFKDNCFSFFFCMCIPETHLFHTFLQNRIWHSFILRPLLWKQIWKGYIEITFVSYNGAKKKKELHMAEWKWVTSESFLIDQSLSKAKQRGKENKHSRNVDLEQTLQRTD